MTGFDYTQYVGKTFEVISNMGVRYTGTFSHILREGDQDLMCLQDVTNHGTVVSVPGKRHMPARDAPYGWVRFKTGDIMSMQILGNKAEPEPEVVDPIVASAGPSEPPQPSQPPAARQAAPSRQPRGPTSAPPPQPADGHIDVTLDRVQEQMSRLGIPRGPEATTQGDFDFSGTSAFEAERERHRHGNDQDDDASEVVVGELDHEPHPSLSAPVNGNDPSPKKSSYNKSSFFDNLSTATARVNRMEERGRNLEAFGEAGDDYVGSFSRGRGRENGPRGGYRGRGGYSGEENGGGRGYYHGRGFDGRGRGFSSYGGQNSGRGGYGQSDRGGDGGRARGRGRGFPPSHHSLPDRPSTGDPVRDAA